MNYQQYLLTKLAEEASEVSQNALKACLFGYESKDPREINGQTNLEKLINEINDLMAVLYLLQIMEAPDRDWMERKAKKVNEYYEFIERE